LKNGKEWNMTDTNSASIAVSVQTLPVGIARDVSVIHRHYPKIGETIAKSWGSVDLYAYLNSIIFDERGGRQGFGEPTASALFRVYAGHRSLGQERKTGDIWDVILEPLK
jgi:hypothetical protein